MRLLRMICLVIVSASGFGCTQEQVETNSGAKKTDVWTRQGLDWPSFLGPDRNSQTAETGLRFDWTKNVPRVVWSKRVGEGYGIGSVANGRYLHFDRQGSQARLTAFHAETGDEQWKFTYPTDYVDLYNFDGGPRSSPVIDGDRVYIHGVEGMLHCLDAGSGDVIWKLDTAERFGVIQNFFGVGSTPLVHEDLLIVMIGGSPEESQEVPRGQLDKVKPDGNAIVAFDKLTGDIRYSTIDDLASYSSPIIAKFGEEVLGLALCRSGLFAFDLATGEQRIEYPYRARKFESVNAATPVVVDSRILITESYGPGGALLKRTGSGFEPVWKDGNLRDAALACHWNTPVVVDGFAYASSGMNRSDSKLVCVDLANRKPSTNRKSEGVIRPGSGNILKESEIQENFRIVTCCGGIWTIRFVFDVP